MAAPIGPGDYVQCVYARRCACGCTPAPFIAYALGSVWQVSDVCNHESPGLLLVGLPTPEPHHCFPAEDFKPIYKPSQSLFLERLMDAPAHPELEEVG